MQERDEDDLAILDTGIFQPGDGKEIVTQIEKLVSPPILLETEREIFQTAPYLDEPGIKEHWQDWLYHLNHKLLADEATTENQRWLATQCALALPGSLSRALRLGEGLASTPLRPFDPHEKLRTQVSTPRDVITYYNWYKQGEAEEFSLQHVFAASKRVLLASYYAYRGEPSYSRKQQYQSHLASYYLLEQALSLDADTLPQAPGK